MVNKYVQEDIMFATQLICELGEIAFEEYWRDEGFTKKMEDLGHKTIYSLKHSEK